MDENEIPRFIREKIEKEKNFGQLVAEIRTDLKNNEKYKPFFDRYNSRSIDSFIDSYAFKKASYLTYGQWYIEREHEEVLKYRLIAEERLWEIQQKKLFNLQCMWRAEMIRLPEIESTYDFEYWEHTIESCSFISPITEEEFRLYREYVLSGHYDGWEWHMGNWQNYPAFKGDHNNEDDAEEIPAWYQYYDDRMGTGSHLLLPDIRGEKEKFYVEIFQEDYKRRAVQNEKASANLNNDRRPYVSAYDRNVLEGFMSEFESAKLFDYYLAYEKNIERSSDDDLELAIETLQEAEEEIPIEAHRSWRTAILNAAKKYEQKRVADALETVYRDYLSRLRLGIAFEVHEKESQVKWYEEYTGTMKSHILLGRQLNGEEANFDF